MLPNRGASLLVACLVLTPAPLRADDPPASAAPAAAAPSWLSEIAVNGFVSVGYTTNLEKPDSRTNAYRVFDTDDGSIRLDVVELVVQKEAKDAGSVGFRVDLTAGSAIPSIAAASGLFRDAETGKAEDFDLQQAYVTWLPSSKVRLDVGKWVTHMGNELIEGYDGWNDNYSRSFLFGYAIPFTHTGVKATFTATDSLTIMGLVTNGWDNVKDNNSSKSFGGQVAYNSTPVSVFANYIGGKERDEESFRHVLDGIVVIRPVAGLTLTLNADWGQDEDAAGPGRDARWYGFAGYVKYALSDSFALALRCETFTDRDGFRTGTVQRLTGFTLTPELKVGKHVVLRGEVRHDRSDEDVFTKRSEPRGSQTTLAFNAIYFF